MMRRVVAAAILSLTAAEPALSAPPPPRLSVTEQGALFKAAGFRKTRRGWESGCDDPGAGAAYQPGTVDHYADINGDGRPEAVLVEGGTFCFGNTGQGFWLLSQQADKSWKLLHQSEGMVSFQKTRGVGGYPDIEVGGPGFCFPILRWNGKAYVRNRFAYEGKPCRP